ncbi:MAG TPA: hypothetical protein VEG44_06390 [Candidatus Acidoferrales bacterium]|nr:hypothetical protein [Candidatus Acidoferrales bacterium]
MIGSKAGNSQLDALSRVRTLEEELKMRATESRISNVLIVCYEQNPHYRMKNTGYE